MIFLVLKDDFILFKHLPILHNGVSIELSNTCRPEYEKYT